MLFKGVIFDLDGTLVNSLEDIADSMNIVLREHNLPTHDLDAYKYFIGNGMRDLVSKSLPETHRDKELIDECYNAIAATYSNNYLNKTKPYDGIEELLEQLVTYDIKIAVLSNKTDEFTKKVVAELLPNFNFISVKGLTDESLKKPNPEVALAICKKMGIEPAEIIYTGDTSVDMETALNAGMYAVGVSWGFRTEEELIASGAKITIKHPMDLLSIL